MYNQLESVSVADEEHFSTPENLVDTARVALSTLLQVAAGKDKDMLPQLDLLCSSTSAELQLVQPAAPFLAIKPAHDRLVNELEKKFANDPAALAEIFTALDRLGPEFARCKEKLMKPDASQSADTLKPTSEQIQAVAESAVAARYAHVMALVQLGRSTDIIGATLKQPLDAKACALDTSGVLGHGFQTRADFGEGDQKSWLYQERYKGAVSPRQTMESMRPLEVWQGQLAEDVGSKTTVFTVTKNGQRVESWKIEGGPEDKTLRVAGLEGPDPLMEGDLLIRHRAELFTAVLRSRLSVKDQQEMLRDLTQLEARARAGDMTKHSGGARMELADTYKQIARLLTDTTSGVTPEYKDAVAKQLARELADPSDIDQGPVSDACRIVTVQYRLATMRPSVVARVTVEALLDGNVRLNKTTTFPLHNDNREPSSPQAITFPRPSDERSFASQLFQVAAMNLLGTNQEIIREHIGVTNEWRQGQPEIQNPQQIRRLEFVQRKEQSDIEKDDTKNEKTKEKWGETYRGTRRPGDPHPFLVKNGMSILIHREGTAPESLTKNDTDVRKDGAHHILLKAYAPQVLLEMMDPDGNHAKCVFAYGEMVKYTGEKGDSRLQRFNSPQELADMVRAAKAAGNLPIIIASRDYGMSAASRAQKNREVADFEDTLDNCDNTHIMIIRDIVPADPSRGIEEHLVTDDFFGKAYDRRVLPRSEWGIYFANTPLTQPNRETQSAEAPAAPQEVQRQGWRTGLATMNELREIKRQRDIATVRRLIAVQR